MSSSPTTTQRGPDRVPRLFSGAALLVSLVALVFSMGGIAPAKREAHAGKGSVVVRLDGHGKIPARYLPIVSLAKAAKKLSGATRKDLTVNCPIPDAVDLGTWCLQAGLYAVPPKDSGKNNFAYAAQKCVNEGGWLPTAAQLIGAAPKVKLASKIDDSKLTAAVEEFQDPKNGIKDTREMSSDLTTVTSGARAAGSEGVTEGSRGNGNLGEPDPVPQPADPFPDTLSYVTVYDNYNKGGFAGGAPVGTPERFRCAFAKGSQGTKFGD